MVQYGRLKLHFWSKRWKMTQTRFYRFFSESIELWNCSDSAELKTVNRVRCMAGLVFALSRGQFSFPKGTSNAEYVSSWKWSIKMLMRLVHSGGWQFWLQEDHSLHLHHDTGLIIDTGHYIGLTFLVMGRRSNGPARILIILPSRKAPYWLIRKIQSFFPSSSLPLYICIRYTKPR